MEFASHLAFFAEVKHPGLFRPAFAANRIRAESSTKSSFTKTGLVSGKRYWFRAAAVGTDDQGRWSDPATKVAP